MLRRRFLAVVAVVATLLIGPTAVSAHTAPAESAVQSAADAVGRVVPGVVHEQSGVLNTAVQALISGVQPGGAGTVIGQGLVAYPGARTSTVMKLRENGGVTIMSVLPTSRAPRDYRFPLALPAGARIAAAGTGGYQIFGTDGTPIAGVLPPWALDAKRSPVPVSYTLDGSTIVMHVDPGPSTAYPVVADPSIDFGLTSATITLNAKDQRIILSGGGAAAGALIGGLICSETGPGAALCAAGGAAIGTIVFEAIKEYAVRDNCDLAVTISYIDRTVTNVSTVCH
jgi:hypothetical protein